MSTKKAAPLTSALLARKGSAAPAPVIDAAAATQPVKADKPAAAVADRPVHSNGKETRPPDADRQPAPREAVLPGLLEKVAAPPADRHNGATGRREAPRLSADAKPLPRPRPDPPAAPEAAAADRPAAEEAKAPAPRFSRRARIAGAAAAGLLAGCAVLAIAVASELLPLEPPAPARRTVERTVSAHGMADTALPATPSGGAEPAAATPTPPPAAEAAADTGTGAAAAAPRPVRRPAQLAAATMPTTAPAASPPAGRYTVQLSSVGSAKAAEREIRRLKRLYPAALDDLPLDVYEAGGRHRIVTERYPTRQEANAVCARLKQAGRGCLVLRR